MVKQLTSWSYSRYSCYTQCPAKAKYKFIDKLAEPGSPAMDRGDTIHKMAEAYTKGYLPKLPTELSKFSDEFKELRSAKPIVEETWAFTSDWNETTWNNWAECAVRIKVDAACVDGSELYIIDHKTGKKREGYTEQLDLYALAGMLKFPHVKIVTTQLWYLDSGEQVCAEYYADDRKKLQAGWDKKVKPLLTDIKFNPKPTNACTFCHFRKSNGGPCKY